VKQRSELSLTSSISISLIIGVVLFLVKFYAFWITSSSAIFSDFTESIIHILAVGFATYSIFLSTQPADRNHPYGHDRISFFSAGFEGAMIVVAALMILYQAGEKLLFGVHLEHLPEGISIIIIVTVTNALLAYWLINKGKSHRSIIVEANGRHIMTDCITSCGVIAGLIIVRLTDILWIDPLIACGTAINIIITGLRLLQRSISGLMDQTTETFDQTLRLCLKTKTEERNLSFHKLRHRHSGTHIFIEYHLSFPQPILLSKAHEIATGIEAEVREEFENADITTHLEPANRHDTIHKKFGIQDSSQQNGSL